mmetsp:Transcript_122999/g.382919  ORF Transcript_122999/g.382919 Transcript_122999/m.382919 type:complete len:445 (+) Transcript_122999:134-1468(+)|eukprot:CAMPEP_0204580188 /NCGR_PEP_ID=MMETSP0661-20131031/43919_1 /ASSEMBLY_ACC=CAM_ASM_000606 /TAXON_ID=109239 /ORGANISM="Alexandrium margalefi, Strain AMGDE01CS-322" /LENGTH=444 /DNA_ID=CAMNT_0051589259 /DNA_START=60 /DNA_END=1394 /DNA_ORIENTATION=-
MANLPNTVLYPQGRDPPRHLLDGIYQGMSELSGSAWHGMHSAVKQPLRYAAREGVLGAGKGLIVGTFTLTESLADGMLDMASYVVEGVRNTPEALADYVAGEDRLHYRHLIDKQEGRMLETYLKRQPKNLPDGILLGGKALSGGLAGGASSLVMKNAQAINEIYYLRDAPKCVGKGLLQGVTGFTTKAASSSLDFAEAVVDGARNTPDYVRCEVFPRVDVGSARLAGSGYEAFINAAHKAGALERAVLEKAHGCWQHRPGLELITPLGAPENPAGRLAGVPSPPVPAPPRQELPVLRVLSGPETQRGPQPLRRPGEAAVEPQPRGCTAPAAETPPPSSAAVAPAVVATPSLPWQSRPSDAHSEATVTSRDRESFLSPWELSPARGSTTPAGAAAYPWPTRKQAVHKPGAGLGVQALAPPSSQGQSPPGYSLPQQRGADGAGPPP